MVNVLLPSCPLRSGFQPSLPVSPPALRTQPLPRSCSPHCDWPLPRCPKHLPLHGQLGHHVSQLFLPQPPPRPPASSPPLLHIHAQRLLGPPRPHWTRFLARPPAPRSLLASGPLHVLFPRLEHWPLPSSPQLSRELSASYRKPVLIPQVSGLPRASHPDSYASVCLPRDWGAPVLAQDWGVVAAE